MISQGISSMDASLINGTGISRDFYADTHYTSREFRRRHTPSIDHCLARTLFSVIVSSINGNGISRDLYTNADSTSYSCFSREFQRRRTPSYHGLAGTLSLWMVSQSKAAESARTYTRTHTLLVTTVSVESFTSVSSSRMS